MSLEDTIVVEDTTPEPEPTEAPVTSDVEPTGKPPGIDEPPVIPDDYQTKMDKRIGKEVKKTKAEEAARIRAETEAAYWKGKAEGAVKPEESPEPAPVVSAKPKPQEDDFETYSDFIEALTDWKAENTQAKWRAEQEQKEAERNVSETQQSYAEKMKVGYEKYDDFHNVVFNQAVPINAVMNEIIMESEAPADIAYYLATHIHECTTISRMPVIKAAQAVGAIEAQLKAAEAANPTPKPKNPNPPEPINPVGGGGEIITKDPSKMTHEEFRKWRMGR